jgi:hypothetical protein
MQAAAKARALGEAHGEAGAMPYSGPQTFGRPSDYLAWVEWNASACGLLGAVGVDDITRHGVEDVREAVRAYCEAYWLASGTDWEDGHVLREEQA